MHRHPTQAAKLDWGGRVGGGIVECLTNRPAWLPYVEISHIDEVPERADRFCASDVLAPRESPAGWRSVVAVPDRSEIAFWESRTPTAHSSDIGLRCTRNR